MEPGTVLLPRMVFEDQPKGLIFVSWKKDGWHDHSFQTIEEAEAFLSTIDGDIYFSPTTYSKPQRKKENVLPSRWLWQDLDYVKPDEITPRPTIAWETSPGRYQALWRLDKIYEPSEIEAINHHLADRVHADQGSWILTKVLRVPGSKNFKYPDHPQGRRLWSDGPTYTSQEVVGRELPKKVQDLLKQEAIGDRSNALWFMEHELANAGFSMQEIYDIVKSSQWNKYKGRGDEEKRLMHEIALAMKDAPGPKLAKRNLKVTTHQEIMSDLGASPGWLIEEWWTAGSHGIIAGEPKSWKSTLAMDAAVSVASGKPFLGQFPVHQQGPVIIVQNENATWIIKERMGAISCHRGIGGEVTTAGHDILITWPDPLPIYYINNQGFTMSNADHRNMLESVIEEVKPVLLIMDPLYLMFDGDINSAKDLNPALNWLLWLKNTYDLSVVIVHHWRKSQGQTKRGGQRMLGSTTLHGWVESAWYVQSGEEVEIEREFRAAQQPSNIKLRMTLGDMDKPLYRVEIREATEDTKEFTEYYKINKNKTITQMSEDLGIPKRRLKRMIERVSGQVTDEVV